MLARAPLALSAAVYAAALVPTPRNHGCTRLCVVEGFAAPQDGKTDATAAINAAIAALPAAGGTVHVPAGDYLIDSTKSIRGRSLLRLEIDDGARFLVKTNTVAHDYCFLLQDCTDVEIIGKFQLIGDRDTFVDQAGTTSEWGHGFAIYNCQRVTIDGPRPSKCVGDGFSIGGKNPSRDIQILGVVADGNRRQGCSIVNADGITVSGEFCNTDGTSPECGIDIEPEAGQVCRNVRLLGVDAHHNAHFGINIEQRAGAGLVDGVLIQNCHVHENASNGLDFNSGNGVGVYGGAVEFNSASGLDLSATTNVTLSGIRFTSNYTRQGIKPRLAFTTSTLSTRTAKDIYMRGDVPAGFDLQPCFFT